MAVRTLAIGPGRIQERLVDAFGHDLIAVQEEDIDHEAARADWIALKGKMTSVRAVGDEGRIRATANAMTDDEATEVAGELVSLAYRVREELRAERQHR